MFFQKETRVFLIVCFVFLLFMSGCGGEVTERASQPEAVQQEAEDEVKSYVESEPVEEEAVEEVKEMVSEEAKDASVVQEHQEPERPAAEGANLALKFEVGDEATYRVITQSSQEVKWEGDLPSKSQFKGGSNETETELTFTQRIENVDGEGGAVAQITIDKLKFRAIKNKRFFIDFDSSKKWRAINALGNIVGKSYKVALSTNGEVSKVIDARRIQDIAKRGSISTAKFASELVNDSSIKKRHGHFKLPSAGEFKLEKGKQWTDSGSFDFGMMGSEVYERVYTLDDIREEAGGRMAIASMEAIPSVKTSTELANQKRNGGLSEMFDNKATYQGELMFDLEAGGISHYTEDLSVQWFTIMPSNKTSGKEPIVLQMDASRKYDLERLE